MAPTEEEDTGLSSGAVAAIVVVILLLLVAAVVIIAIYCYLRSRKKVSELEKPIMARSKHIPFHLKIFKMVNTSIGPSRGLICSIECNAM